jgi:cell wall-associated NlpC family hydrolase
MAGTTKTPQRPTYNPGEEHAEELFPEDRAYVAKGLEDLEKHANQDGTPAAKSTSKALQKDGQPAEPDANIRDVKTAEESSAPWRTNYTSGGGGGRQPITAKGIFKKKGPIAIILALVGGGGIIATLLSPSLLIVNLEKTMVGKFNDQLAAMDTRTIVFIKKKFGNTLDGICGNTISLRCRYNTMSNRQIRKLEAAGVKVNVVKKFGRNKITSLEFGGKTITAGNFSDEVRGSPTFRGAMMRGYNPKLAGFADNLFSRLATRLGINKQANVTGDTDEQRRQAVTDAASGQAATEAGSGVNAVDEDCTDGDDCVDGKRRVYIDEETGEHISREEYDERLRTAAEQRVGIDKTEVDCEGGDGCSDGKRTEYRDSSTGNVVDEAEYNRRLADATSMLEELDARRALANAGDSIVKGTLKGALTSTALGMGAVDSACTGYVLIRTVGAAAQYLGALQLLRYSQAFMNTSSRIEAGEITPEDAEFVGKILTSTNAVGQSATDSYGYHYAAYGDYNGMPRPEDTQGESADSEGNNVVLSDAEKQKVLVADETTRYINGQLVSDNLLTKIIGFIDGAPGNSTEALDDFCGFVKSGWGQTILIAGALVGAVVAFFSGGASLSWGVVAQVAVSVAISVAIAMLTPKLIDMANGDLITGKENGNQAGNAITSGMGAYNHQTAQARALPALTPEDAVAYNQMSEGVKAEYAAVDRLEYSPLDASNPNTFMGSLYTKLVPYLSQTSSISTGAMSLMRFNVSSLASLIPTTNAQDATAEYKVCQDRDYQALNLAVDPFCNVKHGMKNAVLSQDPDVALNYMENNGFVDVDTEDGAPKDDGNEYAKYIENCIGRSVALGGYTEDNPNKGEECIQGSASKTPSTDANCTSGSDNDDTECKRNMFRVFYLTNSIDDGMEKGYASPGGSGSSANQAASAAPAECQSLPATDLGQIACQAYQFDEYGYLWGGGHGGTAKGFMTSFDNGEYTAGSDKILDCSGLVRMAIYEAVGKDIGGMSTEGYLTYSGFTEVSKQNAKAGDILYKPGHTEIIVSNDTDGQKYATFGAHTAKATFNKQIGPSTYRYSEVTKVFRLKQ